MADKRSLVHQLKDLSKNQQVLNDLLQVGTKRPRETVEPLGDIIGREETKLVRNEK